MIVNQAEDLFTSRISFTEFDALSIEEAKRRFSDLQNDGIIKVNSSFEDSVWYTTDEYANIGMHFTFNLFDFKKYEEIFGFGLDEFIEFLKAQLTSLFGEIALDTIRQFLLDVRHIIEVSPEQIYGNSSKLQIMEPRQCERFFSALPADDDELEKLTNGLASYGDLKYGMSVSRQRRLADFETYFLFNDVLEDFWSGQLTNEQRLFFFPLYLWWNLTAVIPLRPREFLLTQRNCLTKNDKGEYILRLRRNQLKGGRGSLKYKIAEDYSVDAYQIPTALGEQIEEYITFTDGFGGTELGTLFVTDMHYRRWERNKPYTSRFLTYTNMVTILHYFYQEVIHDRYGLNIVSNQLGRHLGKNEIGIIRLGDTRHIALINLMQEGGTPAIAMFLSGHMNTEMASAYYTNISTFLECKIARQHRRVLGGQVEYAIRPYVPKAVEKLGTILQSGGKCFSDAYKKGQITDCLNVIGPSGEIGYCQSCKFYSNGDGIRNDIDDFYKRNIKEDCNALQNAIEVVRKGKGEESTIGEAMLRLQSSTLSYEKYLEEMGPFDFEN